MKFTINQVFVLFSKFLIIFQKLFRNYGSGKIIIANNFGGIPEIIRESTSGFLFKKNYPDDLADKIKQSVETFLSGKGEKMQIQAKRIINKFASLNDVVDFKLELL